MKYMGSKNRLSKDLVPIIQSYINKGCNGYIEPFVGGANIIDKINCNKKYGFDIHKQLIEFLNALSTGYKLHVNTKIDIDIIGELGYNNFMGKQLRQCVISKMECKEHKEKEIDWDELFK